LEGRESRPQAISNDFSFLFPAGDEIKIGFMIQRFDSI
jgi:hypothetical protein